MAAKLLEMTNHKNTFIILIFSLITNFFISGSIWADGYKINISIEGNKDSVLLLTSYYGEKIKLIDTAYSQNLNGNFVFESENMLPGGIFMAVSSNKKKLFEFIISDDQVFKISTDTSAYIQNMKISGSDENKLFHEYLLKNEDYFKKIRLLKNEVDSLDELKVDNGDLKKQLELLKEESEQYKIDIINDNKGMFVSRLLQSMRDIEIPDSITNSPDSTLTYKYYRAHYFDNLDLSDSTLLRTPVFMRKVKQYFEQAVVHHPDSVIVAIDYVICKARPNKDVVGYLVWYFMSEYQNPKYMGFDKVFVHIVDEYFSKEEISGTTESILKTLQDRADKLRPILIDSPAPTLIMIDTTGSLVSFYTIESEYTVLFFWDSDCGICKNEIIELNKMYGQSEYDFEIFAININGDLDKWKKAINEKKVPGINVNGTRSATQDFHDLYDIYGTPVIYVLNKEKKIIAKRIAADMLIDFLENYEKRESLLNNKNSTPDK